MPRKRKSRAKKPAYLPRPAARAVLKFLLEKYEMKRPPVATAALLGMLVEMHGTKTKQLFPERQVVADKLGCTIWAVDSALAIALARGLITIEMVTLPSRENNFHPSVKRHRRYVPSQILINVVEEYREQQQRRVA